MEVQFGQCDYRKLEECYIEALKNPDFNNLVKTLNLDKSCLMKHTSKLEATILEHNNCINCKSLHECHNKIKGYAFTPHKNDLTLTFNYVACSYQQEYLESINSSCNYYNMPVGLKSARMSQIVLDDAKRVEVIKWLKNFYDTYNDNPHQKGLYLHGSFGSGKTYLICAMLNELAKYKINITIYYYPELLRSLKEAFDVDFASKINKIKTSSILFLDDIGAEAVTPWARDEILGTILQYRMDANLPTFFTSNLNLEELEIHLSLTKTGVDKVKSRRIIERIKYLTDDMELISKNRRGQ